MPQPKSLLKSLTITDKTRRPSRPKLTPEQRIRNSLIRKLRVQHRLWECETKGIPYDGRKQRWYTDQETGERYAKQVPTNPSKWYWHDDHDDCYYLEIKHRSKRVPLNNKGQGVVKCTNLSSVGLTIQLLIRAVKVGEFDLVAQK